MTRFPKLSLSDIKARTDDRSFERGERYFRDGAIFEPKRQGLTIKARCEGSQGGPYRVQVTFDARCVKEAECSCPVGDGGYCKHVVALLLTWRARPEEFIEVEELDAALERRSKPELIALIKRMLRRAPDLDILIEVPAPGTKRANRPANPDLYHRQAMALFREASSDGWSDWSNSPDLGPILEIGVGFLEQHNFAAASAVFEGVLIAIISEYETVNDEGELADVAGECVNGLGQCLAQINDDPDRREAILRVLFSAYQFALSYTIASEAEIIELIKNHANADERRTVAGWVRAERTPSDAESDWSAQFFARHYGKLLLALEGGEMDDEAYLQFCREFGLTADLVERLLKLKRRDEAAAELKQADDRDFLTLADLFVQHRQAKVAEQAARARSETEKYGVTILDWLKRRAATRRDKTDLRALTEQIFRKQPSLEGYRELRTLTPKDEWPDARGRLLDQLTKAGNTVLLMKIALDDKEIDQAIKLLASAKGHPAGLALEVAEAARATRPREAVAIYKQQAESLIEARGRERYREACRLLKTVRDLYAQLDDMGEWEYYIGVLRERNRSLSALKSELAAARL
jgi:hypothetical protein